MKRSYCPKYYVQFLYYNMKSVHIIWDSMYTINYNYHWMLLYLGTGADGLVIGGLAGRALRTVFVLCLGSDIIRWIYSCPMVAQDVIEPKVFDH